MEKKKSIWARLTALLLSLSLVAGISAWAIDVPTAEQAVDSDYKTLSTDAPEGFATNLTGWHAVTGTWEKTNDGIRGNNKGLDGYYLSDVAYTPGEPFSYEVSFTLNDNSTVAGIIFAFKIQPIQ